MVSCLERVLAKLGVVAPASADTLVRFADNTEASLSEAIDVRTYFANTADKKQRAQCVRAIVELFNQQHTQGVIAWDACNLAEDCILLSVDGRPLISQEVKFLMCRWPFLLRYLHAKQLKQFIQQFDSEIQLQKAFIKVFNIVYTDPALLKKAHILNR